MKIRKESPADLPEIRRLNDLVFAGSAEGSIVDAVRTSCPSALSLVAVERERIIGHVFFSPVTIEGMTGNKAMGLGPMCVHPDFQRNGIGTALVTEGIYELETLGCAVVVVLGHPEYYPRLGFVPANRHGLKCQWEGVPDDVFMVRFLEADMAGAVRGVVRYQKEFETAT